MLTEPRKEGFPWGAICGGTPISDFLGGSPHRLLLFRSSLAALGRGRGGQELWREEAHRGGREDVPGTTWLPSRLEVGSWGRKQVTVSQDHQGRAMLGSCGRSLAAVRVCPCVHMCMHVSACVCVYTRVCTHMYVSTHVSLAKSCPLPTTKECSVWLVSYDAP